MPGLALLPDFKEQYRKIGGTPRHHGPRIYPKEADYLSPDNNHWVDEDITPYLIALTAYYEKAYPDMPAIRYNDISLPNGGLFDIDGDWSPSHDLHRIGQNIDVRTSPPRDDGVPLTLERRIEEILVDLYPNTTVEEHGSKYISQKTGEEIDSRHFHIGFEIFN